MSDEERAQLEAWTRRRTSAQAPAQRARIVVLTSVRARPHRQESCKLSTDPLFIEKVGDVVGLYLNPPERAVVLCVDEKSQGCAGGRRPVIWPGAEIQRGVEAIAGAACLPMRTA